MTKDKDLNLFTFDDEEKKPEQTILEKLNEGISNPIPEAKTDAPKEIKHKEPVFFEETKDTTNKRIATDPSKFTQSDTGSAILRIKALAKQRQ